MGSFAKKRKGRRTVIKRKPLSVRQLAKPLKTHIYGAEKFFTHFKGTLVKLTMNKYSSAVFISAYLYIMRTAHPYATATHIALHARTYKH